VLYLKPLLYHDQVLARLFDALLLLHPHILQRTGLAPLDALRLAATKVTFEHDSLLFATCPRKPGDRVGGDGTVRAGRRANGTAVAGLLINNQDPVLRAPYQRPFGASLHTAGGLTLLAKNRGVHPRFVQFENPDATLAGMEGACFGKGTRQSTRSAAGALVHIRDEPALELFGAF